MKKVVYFLAMIIYIPFYSCENSVVSEEEEPFEISMLYPQDLSIRDTLSVVIHYSENDTTINSTDDIKIFISNKRLIDTFTVIGLKKYGVTEEVIGYYKYHGIKIVKGYGIIVQGIFLRGYVGLYDLEVVIGGQRVKSKDKLGIIYDVRI